MDTNLRAPFPWFGGKRKVAAEVWAAFGDVDNYVEPFFGSGAVLLGRPQGHTGHIETVNDLDGFIANFWRAVATDPEAVAHHADWPVCETDLHARHAWLVSQRADLTRRLEGDPEFCDPKIAGWWVWGCCAWIGSGWCSGTGPWQSVDGVLVNTGDAGKGINRKLPHLGDAGKGINRKLPRLGDAGRGINRQLPHLGNAGQGINRQLPHLGDAGQGINRQLPHLGNAGQGDAILTWFCALADRLRRVRICSGDWSRVVTSSVTDRHGLTGVFLDPPYGDDDYTDGLYAHDRMDNRALREWAITNGDNPQMRIALCGYAGEYDLPGWTEHRWKAHGGYGGGRGNQADANSSRETIWFSPHCLTARPQLSFMDQPILTGVA